MTITLNPAGAGDSWSAGGADFRVLADGSAVDGRWGLVQCTLAPGWGGPPQHIHREHDESFFILTGAVMFTSGRDEQLATSGGLVTAPIGAPHTFRNADGFFSSATIAVSFGRTLSARAMNRPMPSAADTDIHVSGSSNAANTAPNDASSSKSSTARRASVRTRRSLSLRRARRRADATAGSNATAPPAT